VVEEVDEADLVPVDIPRLVGVARELVVLEAATGARPGAS
jgi:hypothetical protein